MDSTGKPFMSPELPNLKEKKNFQGNFKELNQRMINLVLFG